jgi:hypothetical protein
MGWGVSVSSRESVGVLGSAVAIMLYGLGSIGEISRECGCVGEYGGQTLTLSRDLADTPQPI